MIIYKKHDDHVHIYSDKGCKIKQKETGRVYSEAIEQNNGFRYNYVEIEVSANG